MWAPDTIRPAAVTAAGLALALAAPAGATAQLRPLDPIDWPGLDSPHEVTVAVGAGLYEGQRASLAGTEGRLIEFGSIRATWNLGRAALQWSGTALRVFRDDSRFSPPTSEILSPEGGRRVDVGDQRVSTVVRLTEHPGGWGTALRVGVGLPTTDDTEGLERDRTDFFATLGGRYRASRVMVDGEAGIGVHGTRDSGRDQVDPILFAARLVWDLGWARPDVAVVGRHDPRRGEDVRGNEDLGEVRLGLTAGNGRWVRLGAVAGWRPYSPGLGLVLGVGVRY